MARVEINRVERNDRNETEVKHAILTQINTPSFTA